MVMLPQNPSTENGKIPGCSCILSVAPCLGGRAVYNVLERATLGRGATPRAGPFRAEVVRSAVILIKARIVIP